MSAILEDLVVKLSADVKNLNEGLKTATSAVESASASMQKNLKNTEKESKSVFENIKSFALGVFGGNILSSLAGRFMGAMDEAFTSARKLSRGIAEINSVLPDNAQLTKAATDEFLKLSKAYGTDASSQAKAYYDIVTSGIEGAENQMKLLNQANETATAGLITVGESVKILTSALDAYSKSGHDAASISDILFTGARDAGTSFEKFARTLEAVGPYANVAGISLEDLASTMAYLTKQGQDVAVSGNQIQAMIAAIIKSTPEAAAYARQLGINWSESGLRAKGLAGFLQDVNDKTGGNVEALRKLFPRMEALSGVTKFTAGDLSQLAKILGDTSNAMGATERAAAKVKESMDFKLTTALSQMKELATELLVNLSPAILVIIRNVNDLIVGITRLGQMVGIFDKPFENLDEVVDKIKSTREEINSLIVAQNNSKKENEILGGRDVEIENRSEKIKKLKEEYLGLQEVYKNWPKTNEPTAEGMTGGTESEGAKREPALTQGKGNAAETIGEIKAYTEEEEKRREAILKSSQAMSEFGGRSQEINKAQLTNLQEAHEMGLISDEEYFAAKNALIEEQNAMEFEAEAAKFESDMEALQTAYEAKLISHDEYLAAKYGLDEQYEIKKDVLNKKADLAEKKIADEKKKKEKKDSDEKTKVTDDFFKNMASMSDSHNKTLSAIGKIASIRNATVNTYEAITKTLSAYPGPLGIGMAIATGAFGFAQVAQMAKFEKGITEIPPGYRNDTFYAGLTSGERVVDADTNSDLKQALSEGGLGRQQVEISFKGEASEILEVNMQDRMDRGTSKFTFYKRI